MRTELQTFSKNIKVYLEYYGMQQAELAGSIGVDPSSITKWIKGEVFPRIGKIDEMCVLFHCSRSDLLEHEQTPTTIKRKLLLNRLNAKIETLNDAGIEKVITMIQDLNESYKESK